jgi:exodeoxyribonuclease V beta subunit
MTDLAHVAQVLHELAHAERLGLPALLDWLRTQCQQRGGSAERNRRLDSDAAAVQIMTVWVSKGLQYPLVYLPFGFNRYVPTRDIVLYHQDGRRCLDIGGKGQPGFKAIEERGRQEMAGDDIRLTYVALTRAQSQVVAWWAPSWDEPNGGLSRLLRGRTPGTAAVPDRCQPKVSDTDALRVFREWETAGGPVVEESLAVAPPPARPGASRGNLGVRRFGRAIDTSWRRTSYSGLIRSAEESRGVGSEPEVVALDDEVGDLAAAEVVPAEVAPSGGDEAVSPMADLPAGATFGSLVHGVLEHADPFADDLAVELATQVRDQLAWWPVDAGVEELATALVPLHHTPLGPLAPGWTLGRIGLPDRLRELDFEIPLAGGDRADGPEIRLADVGRLLREHLPADDPLAPYSHRLLGAGLAEQSLRGYLSGSIDVVLRVPDGEGHRYLVVDYKTNRLGDPDRPLTAADYAPDRLADAMLHSDYPLQALLYIVVVHRYLRWRQPGYDPATHLGGVLYLYVRGMCGAETPVVDGHPAGVFSWSPPAALVTALSDLLDGRRGA